MNFWKTLNIIVLTVLLFSSSSVFAQENTLAITEKGRAATQEEVYVIQDSYMKATSLYNVRTEQGLSTKTQTATLSNSDGLAYNVTLLPVTSEPRQVNMNSYELSYVISLEEQFMQPANEKTKRAILNHQDSAWDTTGSVEAVITLTYDKPVSNKYKLTGARINAVSYQSNVLSWEYKAHYYCNGSTEPVYGNEMRKQEGTVGTIYNNHYFDLTSHITQYIYQVHSFFNRVGIIAEIELCKGTSSYWTMTVPCFIVNDIPDYS